MERLSMINDLIFIQRKILEHFINKGDICIDATLGNANDSEFLLEKVGENGRVYAYDIQEDSIKNAEKIFKKNIGINLFLFQKSHEYLDDITNKVKCIIYNLGYLPGSDKKIVTNYKSTILSLNNGLKILSEGGIISVTSYISHDGGIEYEKINEFLQNLDSKKYKVIKIDPLNQDKKSPKLFLIQKNMKN